MGRVGSGQLKVTHVQLRGCVSSPLVSFAAEVSMPQAPVFQFRDWWSAGPARSSCFKSFRVALSIFLISVSRPSLLITRLWMKLLEKFVPRVLHRLVCNLKQSFLSVYLLVYCCWPFYPSFSNVFYKVSSSFLMRLFWLTVLFSCILLVFLNFHLLSVVFCSSSSSR